MARIYRRPTGGSRYYTPKGKGGGGASRGFTVRVTLFTLLIALACTVRFAQAPLLVAMREKVGSLVRTDSDYRGAVAVIGRAVAGESEEDESAILVFGRKLLGLEEADADAPATETQEAAGIGEAGEPPGTEPPETEPPGTDSPAPVDGQGGGSGLGAALDTTQAGGDSGFVFEEADYACEAVLPVFVPSPVLLSSGLLWDEMDDDTPDAAFEIPSPDNVDDRVYTLPFDYAAPASGPVSSYFGYRIHPISGNTTFHHGADLAIVTGTKVRAFAAGKVSETGYHSVYGNYVKLDHGDGFVSLYAHLDSVSAKKGKSVKLGDVIAKSGNSGYSTGAHLHFEIRREGKILNPFDYVSFE